MAKTVTLTVQVDDAQFQAFTKNFDAFVLKVQSLTTSFNTIQTSITNTTKSAQTLNTTLSSLLSSSNRLHTSITGITHQFGRWATLIGGTVMMLGGGAGMFGLDRLLNSFIQRQRQALGMGGSYQQTLAGQVAGQQFPGNVAAQISNITDALHDPSKPGYKTFSILGIDTRNKTPEQIRRELLRKGADYIGAQRPETALMTAGQIGFTSLMGEDKVRSMLTPEGRRAAHKEAALSERLEKEIPKVTQEEQDKLDKLFESWTTFTATFKADLLKMLSQLAPFLTGVSNVATRMLPKSFADWLTIFNPPAYLVKKGAEATLDYFGIGDFKKNMDDISKTTGELVDKLNTILKFLSPVSPAQGAEAPGGSFGPAPSFAAPGSSPSPPAAITPGSTSAPASPASSFTLPTRGNLIPSKSADFINSFAVPKAYGSARSTTKAGPSSAPWMSSPDYGSQAPLSPSFTPGGPPLSSGKQGSLRSNQFAVNRAAPGKGGLNSMFAQYNHSLLASLNTPGGPMGRPGPLDMEQWQMGRTASIHVHNEHPSIRMEIAGMG
jgi:hypothetical protein